MTSDLNSDYTEIVKKKTKNSVKSTKKSSKKKNSLFIFLSALGLTLFLMIPISIFAYHTNQLVLGLATHRNLSGFEIKPASSSADMHRCIKKIQCNPKPTGHDTSNHEATPSSTSNCHVMIVCPSGTPTPKVSPSISPKPRPTCIPRPTCPSGHFCPELNHTNNEKTDVVFCNPSIKF